jgi:hypothetical protein
MKTGVKGFPITHTNRYRQCNVVDINNLCGRGCNAIFSGTGCDKSKLLYLAPSVEEYLGLYYAALKDNRFYEQNGQITVFRNIPQELCGSVTVT